MTRMTAASVSAIDDWKNRIQTLYEQNPQVCLNISLTHSKVVQGAAGRIIGVYRHCFCVEEYTTGTAQRHTFTYADLLTRRVEIRPAD